MMKTDATFSKCRKYRYVLWRIWDDSKPYVMFIGLNPSTADETTNDPTITRTSSFARDWGYGGLCMVNLFAFRATQPSVLMAAKNPIGLKNDNWIIKLAETAGTVVAAWGNDGSYLGRSEKIIELIPNLQCLKMNKTGQPAHPLYQPASATLTNMAD
jgi:hypothetical protein